MAELDPDKIIRCGTTEYMNERIKKDPSLADRLKEYEKQIQDWIAKEYPTERPPRR